MTIKRSLPAARTLYGFFLSFALRACLLFSLMPSFLHSQGLSPTTPAKEYIYIGGKLVAIDSPSAAVPAAPSNLSATAVSSSQINLTWSDNSNNETGFKIERKTGAGGTYSQIITVGAGVTTYPNPGLSASTTYFYRVRAYNGAGDSPYSNEASATTHTPPAPPQPTSLSISPSSVSQGQCYTMTVGNGANMTVDVQYTFNGGPVQTVNQYAVLNANGQAFPCSDMDTAVGTWTIVNIRNTLNTAWVPVSASIQVTPGQPTSLSISPGSVSQGQCYTMTVGNGKNMTLDIQYQFNGGPIQEISDWPVLNSNGQATICTDALTTPGTYTFVNIRNTLNTAWVPVFASVIVNASEQQ